MYRVVLWGWGGLLWVTGNSAPKLTAARFAAVLPAKRYPFKVFTKVNIISQFFRVWPQLAWFCRHIKIDSTVIRFHQVRTSVTSKSKKVNQSRYSPRGVQRVPYVKAPRFRDNSTGWW